MLALYNMNNTEVITSNNLNKNQIRTDQAVTHPLPPTSVHLNTGHIANPYHRQPVPPIYQNSQNVPVAIMSYGMNINNLTEQPIVNIPKYKTRSICNTICCCVILGVLACVKSQETREQKRYGNLQGALQASRSAKILNFCATVIGIVLIIIVSVLIENIVFY